MLNGFKETEFLKLFLLNLSCKIHVATAVQECILGIVGVRFTYSNRYLGQEFYP